ncbi:biotin synthase BioB [Paenibacillus sp.]|jgi:biotin synthase|uniref:biotin synthase BioB n=1 Tax=Paenibacillus sp. TaxID=58172 RepID=UPI0028181451|nr:biotin synthase BioB [Paenibacillus sp.]MDR0270395.1 biotin synthase BioB [Paenibacillus sp.]
MSLDIKTAAQGLDWQEFAEKALRRECLSVEEALSVLNAEHAELLPMLQAAFTVRKHFFGVKVKLNMIFNAKSGLCPENCGYCSQSTVSTAPVEKYSLLDKETILAGAREAINRKAGTYCIVASGRGPTPRELDQVAEAGVHRYNHNLNTSRGHYENITTTHSYEQRVDTVEKAKAAGISPCSGVIVGMGETDREIVDMAYALREMDVDSIPVNFLIAIPGTPLQDLSRTSALKALKVLTLFRFICPSKEIRVSGGRESTLRSLQPLALYAANSIFVGDYLTTEGQDISADHAMIEDLGFEIEMNALE